MDSALMFNFVTFSCFFNFICHKEIVVTVDTSRISQIKTFDENSFIFGRKNKHFSKRKSWSKTWWCALRSSLSHDICWRFLYTNKETWRFHRVLLRKRPFFSLKSKRSRWSCSVLIDGQQSLSPQLLRSSVKSCFGNTSVVSGALFRSLTSVIYVYCFPGVWSKIKTLLNVATAKSK